MHLPVETVEEILNHLPPYDKKSLRNCSLITKSWLDPCQRRLFERVRISSETCQSWLDNISPNNTVLLSHVRELVYFAEGERDPQDFPTERVDDGLSIYLPSFCQLQRLTFDYVDIEPTIPHNPTLFFAFQHSLSSLTLLQVSITWGGFVTLLGYFPNLRNLEIREMQFKEGIRPTPRPPCALRGRLLVHCTVESTSYTDRFAGLDPEYEELVLMGEYDQDLVTAVEDNLKFLRITKCVSHSGPDLSRCPKLQQLEIDMLCPRKKERDTISSITSTNLRKIIFKSQTPRLNWSDFMTDHNWGGSDKMICGLVGRLRMSGYKDTLEVEFRAEFVDLGEKVNHEEFLPKFKERGRVRIVETSSGEFREWP